MRPDFYPDRPDSVEVRETHISWVFLAGDRAYKLKKPIVLPFLDYGSPERRRAMCLQEVQLNRRLAPDVYLGVRSLVAGSGGLELAADDDRRAVDYLVEMRRYDEHATLAAWLRRGELKRNDVARVGRLLARFHRQAEPARVRGVVWLAVERRMLENFHELLAIVEQRVEFEWVLSLERFTHAFLVAHAQLLDARARNGLVREGHGDLRAEHIVLGRKIEIVDCVEFDRGLRELDVADDLAFLVMDLVASGGERFAQALVRAYRAGGGDPGADWLIAFYAAHRALVRAKVALVRASQQPASSSARGHGSAVARDLLLLAERFAWQARLPLVIVICGVPGSGKSHLARALAEVSGLPHVSSDVTRKRLVGVKPRQRAGPDAYTPDFSRLTYVELARRAARQVRAHHGAIVDATFRHRADREAFNGAFDADVPTLYIECRVPVEVLIERARRRDQEPDRISDASLSVVMRESVVWDPLDELRPEAHVTLRSDLPVSTLIADLRALLDGRLGRLRAQDEAAGDWGAPDAGQTGD